MNDIVDYTDSKHDSKTIKTFKITRKNSIG